MTFLLALDTEVQWTALLCHGTALILCFHLRLEEKRLFAVLHHRVGACGGTGGGGGAAAGVSRLLFNGAKRLITSLGLVLVCIVFIKERIFFDRQ
jgi:hypothetical protein